MPVNILTCSRKIEGTAASFDREVNSWNQNCNHTLDLFTVTNSMMVHEIDWYDNIKNLGNSLRF